MEDVWKHCVNRLLKAWTGYQLAVRMLSGGSETYQKAEWFAEVLTDYVSNSRHLQVHNLNDWISDILDNEFNLILEDNSVEWLASSLLKCSSWLNAGQKAELEDFLSHLPSENAVQTAATESQILLDNSDENSDYEELENGTEDEDKQTKKPLRRRMETDEDGWTTITRR
uniref:Pre-rRNA-processing protein TSR2 homolog n=1 Tax=Setaria digitata TaxID=48799 RepID=A0A915PUX0_9BILA